MNEKEYNALLERLAKIEKDVERSKADHKRIREALKRLIQQEKSARGQMNFSEIVDILDEEGE